MLVIDSKRAVVLNTPRPDAILQAVPHARTFEHEGKTLTVVPHGVEETKVLRNLGYKKTPSPILFHYKWPGRNILPMQHQKETAAFLTLHKRGLCLNSPGTGKSVSALWAADFLREQGLIEKILIVAPLSTLTPVWAKELKHHFVHLDYVILTGTKQQRQKLLEKHHDIAIINHDGFTLLHEKLEEYDLIIYDEATAVKTPSAKRFRALYKHVEIYQPWLWLMTGTPVSQNPTDAWTLSKLVQSPYIPRSYTAFKDIVMQKVSNFRWIPRKEAAEICKKVLQPSVAYNLDECVDLPPTVFLDHECKLSPEQQALFKEMRETAVLTLHDVSAPNAAVVFAKLIQICCGAAYNMDGDVVQFDAQDRIDTLLELIEEIGDKLIVFVPLRGVQDVLHKMLKAKGYDVAVVHGDVNKTARNEIFYDFQNTDKYQILLAHPKVAAHGLTLTRAKDIIWYAPIYSLEQYEQANARIRRLVTEGKTRVHHIYATMFEKELYRRLAQKKLFLSELLDLVKGVNE
jgi:SNF2 family DNA or RNA helicase